MKLLIASDIHGDYEWASKLMKVFEEGGYAKLLLLGDILYHGPRNEIPSGYHVKKTYELLNQYKDQIICVKGNCDSEVDQMVLDFDISKESRGMWVDEHRFHLTHGHRDHKKNLPWLFEGDVYIQGHTHQGVLEVQDGVLMVNPGSVSIPKDGHHSYVTYEDNTFTLKDFSGQVLKELTYEKNSASHDAQFQTLWLADES